MEKMSKLLAFFVALTSILAIQSCDDDEKPQAPALTGPTTVASVQVSASTPVNFTYVSKGGFKSSSVTATGGTAAVSTDGTAGSKEGTIVVTFTADSSPGAATVTLIVTDNENQESNSSIATLNKSISAPPTVALSAESGAGNPGTTVTLTATVTAANGAKTLTVAGITSTPASPITLSGSTEAVAQELALTIPSDAVVGSTINVAISATDNQSLTSSPVVFVITVSDPTNFLTGTLSEDMTLTKDVPYLVKSQFIVPAGMTLTVEPGAVIKGDKATKAVIIIQPGGKLMAVGTAAEPIVFTSSQNVGERDRGDWGGIVWLGNAYVNQASRPAIEGISPTQNYGTVDGAQANATVGSNDEDNGKLVYARIEYAGIELSPNNETNSLTMGALGSATEIDYVQTSYGGDDGFEWFGGTVNAKHLISLATWDDDFDTDFGWRGNVQFGVVVRAPFVADQSGSTSFESDSQGNGNPIGTVCTDGTQTGCTRGVFSNITVYGPRDYSRSTSANYTRAMHLRRRTAISIYNSVIAGFATGLTMDDAGTINNYTVGAGELKNNVLFVPILPVSSTNNAFASGNAYYSSNVSGAATGTGGVTGTVAPLWENTNAIEKGFVATKADATFAAGWAATEVPADNIINPYTAYGFPTANFYGASSAATYTADPAFVVTSGTIQGLVAADLFPASSKVDNAFFDKTVTYKGAFGAVDWTDGWSGFQPINQAY
jgi:hypothetical protein